MLSDPCPLPDKTRKRSLNEKEKLIFAPMSGVGGVMYDKVCNIRPHVRRGGALCMIRCVIFTPMSGVGGVVYDKVCNIHLHVRCGGRCV